eukprot:9385_1
MAISWSGIVSIIYFSMYTTVFAIIAIHVWRKEEHKLDKTFLKSIWIQRKIYIHVLVYFYDTATDIGVLITWYNLYSDDTDYKTIDMAVFFWSGCAVLIFYRFISLCVACIVPVDTCVGPWGLLLALFDLYIFVGIYESFQEAQEVIDINKRKVKKKRKKNKKKPKKVTIPETLEEKLAYGMVLGIAGNAKQTFQKVADNNGCIRFAEMKIALAGLNLSDSQINQCVHEIAYTDDTILDASRSDVVAIVDYTDFSRWYPTAFLKMQAWEELQNYQKNADRTGNTELLDIDPAIVQYYCMLAEGVFESMPQIVLQSVFLIRSTNDPILSGRSTPILVFMSLIASIFSVANKFYLMDKHGVIDEAKSLKPKAIFPNCCQPWYITRILWRFCHILCRFSIFSLLWLVIGGAVFGIYMGFTAMLFCGGALCISTCANRISDKMSIKQFGMCVLLGNVSIPLCHE